MLFWSNHMDIAYLAESVWELNGSNFSLDTIYMYNKYWAGWLLETREPASLAREEEVCAFIPREIMQLNTKDRLRRKLRLPIFTSTTTERVRKESRSQVPSFQRAIVVSKHTFVRHNECMKIIYGTEPYHRNKNYGVTEIFINYVRSGIITAQLNTFLSPKYYLTYKHSNMKLTILAVLVSWVTPQHITVNEKNVIIETTEFTRGCSPQMSLLTDGPSFSSRCTKSLDFAETVQSHNTVFDKRTFLSIENIYGFSGSFIFPYLVFRFFHVALLKYKLITRSVSFDVIYIFLFDPLTLFCSICFIFIR